MKKALLIIGVVAAVGLLLLGGLMALSFLGIGGSGSGHNTIVIEKEAEEPPELALRSFRQLRGTQYFLAEIVTGSGRGVSYYEYGSSSRWFEFGEGGSGLIRNIVFLDSESIQSHTLFEDNHSFIIDMISFPPQASYSSDDESEIIPIRWFVYEVAHDDTNRDGALNRDDIRVIGVSDVDGTRYKELIPDVSHIYNLTMLDGGELLAIYRQNGDRFATKIDLQAQEIIATQQIPDLGIEVE